MKRQVCFVSIAVCLVSFEAIAEIGKERADSYKLQKMKYDVYAGGMNVVKGNLTVDLVKSGKYRMYFGAETRGFLEMLAPWVGTFESNGWVVDGNLMRPKVHESIAMWRGEREVKTYTYTKDGGFVDLVTTYKGKKPRKEITSKELTHDTTDVLAATINVMQKVSQGEKCEGESEVYDGSRRYKLIYKHKRFVKMEASRYNVYSGPAVECTVEVEPVAGRWYEKPRGWMSIQEQGRKLGMMPTVWFAQLRENAMVVPVQVRVKTEYGAMFMHMTHYESGKTVLSMPD